MSDPVCAQCGLPADAHHDFQPYSLPAGCQCDPLTWGTPGPSPVCDGYKGSGKAYCQHCEHDRACHGGHDA